MAGGRGVALPIPRFSVTRDKKQSSWRTWAINITGNEQSVRKQGNDVYPKHKRLKPCTTRTIIFQRENSNYLIVCFTQCTLVFQHLFFSIANMFAVLYLWKTYVAKHGDKRKRTECPSKTCKTKSFLKAVTLCSDVQKLQNCKVKPLADTVLRLL